MRTFNIVVERDPDTGRYVGYVPGWPGAHSQGETLDELRRNLQETEPVTSHPRSCERLQGSGRADSTDA